MCSLMCEFITHNLTDAAKRDVNGVKNDQFISLIMALN